MPLLPLLLAAAAAHAAGPNPAPWTPPAQSAAQAATFSRAAAKAQAASAAATPALLQALALPSVQAALKECGAPELPPQQLLDRIDLEVAVTETVHGFGSLGHDNQLGEDSSFLCSLWQLPLLPPAADAVTPQDSEGHDCYPLTDVLRVNATVCSEYGWQLSKAGSFPQVPLCKWQTSSSMCINTVPAGLEAVETGLYGFEKFKVRGAPQNFEEASGRMIYAAFNRKCTSNPHHTLIPRGVAERLPETAVQNLDTGSTPLFGSIGMVFKPGFIRNMTQLAATDTGLYAGCILQAKPDLIEPSGLAICSQQHNATSCNYRINCDWVSPEPGNATATHVCKDNYCPHWTSSTACKTYAGIGCEWHILERRCHQITGSVASARTIAPELQPAPVDQQGPDSMRRRVAGPQFPMPPSVKIMNFALKREFVFIKSESFCTKNEELCIQNGEFSSAGLWRLGSNDRDAGCNLY